MDNEPLTYKQLAAKLKALGYRQYRSAADGKTAQMFEHETLKSATILLPDAAPDDEVAAPFLQKVLIILKTHGLIEEMNSPLT